VQVTALCYSTITSHFQFFCVEIDAQMSDTIVLIVYNSPCREWQGFFGGHNILLGLPFYVSAKVR